MATSHYGDTKLDDDETEPVSTLELYTPTVAQGIIIKFQCDYLHVLTVSFSVVIKSPSGTI